MPSCAFEDPSEVNREARVTQEVRVTKILCCCLPLWTYCDVVRRVGLHCRETNLINQYISFALQPFLPENGQVTLKRGSNRN